MRIKLAVPLTLSEIAEAIRAELNVESREITHISTDSRICEPGDLFFALRGEKIDASTFLKDAKNAGAYNVGGSGDLTTCDSVHAILMLASYYKKKLSNIKCTIAITGSVGKSTTKEILASILSDQYKVHKTHENFNNILGVSYTLLSAPLDCEILILELGMNHKGEIAELSEAVCPDIGVITNIGTSHIGNLGSRKSIALAKLEIKSGLRGDLIIPDDEPLLENEIAYRFSLRSTSAYLCVKRSEKDPQNYNVYKNGVLCPYTLKIDADHIACNTSAAFTAAELCNFTPRNEYDFTVKFSNNTRQTILKTHNFDILCDFYNASLESFISGFRYAVSLNYEHKSALIGDVLELGEYSASIHYEIGKSAAEYGFEKLYIFGDLADCVKAGAISAGFSSDKIYINRDTQSPEETARQILSTYTRGELIYAKASHKLDLGRITDLLKEQK